MPVCTSSYHRLGRLVLTGLLAGLFLASGAARGADSPPLILEHLTTADGLPQGTVFATFQDSQGFVWLGTEDGLIRYDGHEIVRYAASRSATGGLPGNYIQAIAEDTNHDLWIAVKDGGVARWSRARDTFTIYRHESSDPGSLASDAVHDLMVDGRGRIWIASTDAGIDILDPNSGRIEHVRHSDDPHSLLDDHVFSLALGRDGILWVGTDSGLDKGRTDSRSFVHYQHVDGNPATLSGKLVSRVSEDASGDLWVGTRDGGLDRMDRDGRVLEVFRHDALQPASLVNDDVRAILADHAGHLWIGTADGLDLLNRTSRRFGHYRHDQSDSGTLRDSYIMSLYQDQGGLLWIGTRAGGVSRWNPHSWEFGGHRPDWLGSKLVTAFADAPDNKVWIATLGGGLVRYDEDSGRTVDFDALVGKPNGIGDQRVMSLRQDRAGNLWIGTMAAGLKKLGAGGQVQSVPVRPGDARGLSAAGIMTLYEARSGHIWVGTFGGGANVLDPVTGMVRQLPYGSAAGNVSSANVTAIVEDREGYFWIGTDGGGLDLARADGTVIRVFRHDPKDPQSLPSNTVYALAVDAQNRVWAGTDGGGLALVQGSAQDPRALHFKVSSREEGLSSDTIYGVLADAGGRLWLSSDAGLMRYDTNSGAIKTYHRENGLQGEEFDFGAAFRLRDGRLCFGGPGGFNIFDPTRLSENHAPPRLALTRLEVMGVPAPGPTPYWLMDRIELGYRANIVSLEFGALDFMSPKRNRLAYRMGGLTDQWIDIGEQRRITLTNLDAGDHVLEVRASNSDSLWSPVPLRLRIHRDPVPWRSPWAYATYALAVLLLVAYRIRAQRIRFARMAREAERIERLAYYDTLTGLPNRQRCVEIAERLFAEAAASGDRVAVIYLSLNSFKRVNDTFGHSVGDEVLKSVAAKLTAALGHPAHSQRPTVSRFGGDEFVILLRDHEARAMAIGTAERCGAVFKDPIAHRGLEFYAAPNIGIAVYPEDGADVATVLKHADIAMNQAKSGSSAQVSVYTDAMSSRLRDWLDLEARLRHAVQGDLLHLYFQPKFRLIDRKLAGVEALVRWTDPEHGEIAPNRFVEIAEDSGLIIELGSWVVRAACRQMRAWLDQGFECPIAINVSAKELLHGDTAKVLEIEAAAANVPTSLIEIEITESLLVKDSATVRRALERLRQLGCRIALDDFGTGYSSLAYLTRFPPDRIKIDKAFVRNVDRAAGDAAVATAILSLGASLDLTVTAEGVERSGQLEWLRQRGCDEVQGFLLSKPLSAAELQQRYALHLPAHPLTAVSS